MAIMAGTGQRGITAVPGFLAAGLHAGVKKGRRPDLALIVSEREAVAAALFTTNRFKAAPILVSRDHLSRRRAQAIIATSGNANACTGRAGFTDARALARDVARGLGIPDHLVVIASTGVIGQRLPLARLRTAVPHAIASLSRTGGRQAAVAILTTDTRPKEVVVRGRVGGRRVTIGGLVKGSGMIHPQLAPSATMLAFLGTDARIEAGALQRALQAAGDDSFNRTTIDGQTSTNDMVVCLANGLAGNREIQRGSAEYRAFAALLARACQDLARQMVMDGEGATKFVEVRIRRARTPADARRLADAVAGSPLVKTALYGADPNWGRVMAALGASGLPVIENRVTIAFGGVVVARGGVGVGPRAEAQARARLARRTVTLEVDLGAGRAEARLWTTDLSPDYVTLNAAYRS